MLSLKCSEVVFRLITLNLIKEYPHDKPYPSYLILGYIDNRPVHIVLGEDGKLGRCIVITTYEPDETIWQVDFKSKK
jgi:hypothetical protein